MRLIRTSIHKPDGWSDVGTFIYRFRFSCIVLLLIVASLLGFAAPKLPSVLGGDGFQTEGDYEATQDILESDFQQSEHTLILMLQKQEGATERQFTDSIASFVKRIEERESYASFQHPLQNPMMRKDEFAYATILLKRKTQDELADSTLRFAERMQGESNAYMKVLPTGFSVINQEINSRSQSDLKKAEMIGLPIAFLVLLASFGSLLASLLPIINGALSVVSTMGILYYISREYELSIFVLNVAPMIGFALSIDFALLFVNRFREELAGRSPKEAIALTYQTAGRAIVFSGLCVFVGLSGLFFFQVNYIQSVAISGMIVVVMSLLFSLTLLPAALSLMAGRLARIGKQKKTESVWRPFANFVMNHPVMMTAVVLSFIAISLLPLRTADFQFPGIESLPENSNARIAYEQYEREFNTVHQTHAGVTIVAEMEAPLSQPESLEKLEGIVMKLYEDPHVYEVGSLYSVIGEVSDLRALPQSPPFEAALSAYIHDNRALLHVALDEKPKSEEAKQWVRDFKEQYREAGVTYYAGGMTTFEQELQDEITDKVPVSMTVILGSTILILMTAFRSLLIPIKAVLMNILSLSATIGIIVWLFQGGHFGFEQSTIMFVLPVFIFGLVFGLSMDYEVFLISRIYELYEETNDNDYATLEGLVSTSRIITSAALIMIVVTGAFAFTEILPVQQMGLGVALAIFLDATIIRLLLVPSLMKLLGDWNWWFFNKRRERKEAANEGEPAPN